MSKKTKYSLLIVAMFVFATFVMIRDRYVVSAGAAGSSTKHLSGYAWSSNIGWISFVGSGVPPLYEVTYDADPLSPGYRKLSGYAWSSNIGWISFGCGQPDGTTGRKLCSQDLAGGDPNYPTGGGVIPSGPTINSTDNKLVGFARACSVFASGCSGALRGVITGAPDLPENSPDLGGWDGWISLSGSTSGSPAGLYGISFNDSLKEFSGFAWGGGDKTSQVPGWISFKNAEGAASAYGVVMQDTPSTGITVTCERSSFPVVGVPITWTASVNQPGEYNYHWNIGGTKGTQYNLVPTDASVDTQSITVKYLTEGSQTTNVEVTIPGEPEPTLIGSCSPVVITRFDVRPLGFEISHVGDMNADYSPDGGIIAYTYPLTPVSVSSVGDYTSSVTLKFDRIEDSQGNVIGRTSTAAGVSLIVTPQFRNSKYPAPATTITLDNVGGIYDSASLRLVLTKNQDEAASGLLLPSGDYTVYIDSTSGSHLHPITLHLSNPTGGVIER